MAHGQCFGAEVGPGRQCKQVGQTIGLSALPKLHEIDARATVQPATMLLAPPSYFPMWGMLATPTKHADQQLLCTRCQVVAVVGPRATGTMICHLKSAIGVPSVETGPSCHGGAPFQIHSNLAVPAQQDATIRHMAGSSSEIKITQQLCTGVRRTTDREPCVIGRDLDQGDLLRSSARAREMGGSLCEKASPTHSSTPSPLRACCSSTGKYARKTEEVNPYTAVCTVYHDAPYNR
jgi:hypothetical protein